MSEKFLGLHPFLSSLSCVFPLSITILSLPELAICCSSCNSLFFTNNIISATSVMSPNPSPVTSDNEVFSSNALLLLLLFSSCYVFMPLFLSPFHASSCCACFPAAYHFLPRAALHPWDAAHGCKVHSLPVSLLPTMMTLPVSMFAN